MHELSRYFIELQPLAGPPVPRARETEQRRERAAQFIADVGAWLRQEALDNKVSAMAMTALGQVQITCADEVIHQIRHHDSLNIAAIRRSTMRSDGLARLHETR